MLLTKHEGETFRNQTVYISGQAFIRCTFTACTLILRETVYHLEGCTFERCNWHVDWVLMWGSPESIREIKALAARLPVDGQLIENPHTTWSDVDPSLPDQEIQAFIPGTKHGTREVFEEKVILAGCEVAGAWDAFLASSGDEDAAEEACLELRTDGRSADIDGDYNETLARLRANPGAVGVFGLAFYENNTAELQVATMSGVAPSTETIASGEYPVSRPLFFYLKTAHLGVIPGLKEFAEFFVWDDVAGPEGPLAEYGLVSDPELAQVQQAVAEEREMQPPAE